MNSAQHSKDTQSQPHVPGSTQPFTNGAEQSVEVPATLPRYGILGDNPEVGFESGHPGPSPRGKV